MASGIEFIDEQHRELFEHINNFYNSLNKKPDKTTLAELFQKLNQYTLDHFAAEERIMEESGFPGIMAHKAEHTKFLKAISSFAGMLQAGKLMVSVETINYFKEWINEHISVSDKNYCMYLNTGAVRV